MHVFQQCERHTVQEVSVHNRRCDFVKTLFILAAEVKMLRFKRIVIILFINLGPHLKGEDETA